MIPPCTFPCLFIVTARPQHTSTTSITSSACYLVPLFGSLPAVRCLSTSPSRHRLMKPRSCPELGFERPHSTQLKVLSRLHGSWKSVEVKASLSVNTASWTTVGFTSTSPSPLRHLISITPPRPFFPHCLHIGIVLLLVIIKLGSFRVIFIYVMYV